MAVCFHQCCCVQYNAVAGVAVSVDTNHFVEYWCGPRNDYQFPKNVQWEHKTDTDLFDFLKVRAALPVLSMEPLHLTCMNNSVHLGLSHDTKNEENQT